MKHANYRQHYLLAFTLIALMSVMISSTLLSDYYIGEDFLTIRLAKGLSEGYGPVYNAGETSLLTISPLRLIPFALTNNFEALSALMHSSGLAFLSIILPIFLRDKKINTRESLVITLIVVVSYPTWSGMRSVESIMITLFILSLIKLDNRKYGVASILLGIVSIIAPSGIIALIIGFIYAIARQNTDANQSTSATFYIFAMIPLALWVGGWAVVHGLESINGLAYLLTATPATSSDWVWLVIFMISAGYLYRIADNKMLYIFPLWATLDIVTPILYNGAPVQITSIPVSITIGLSTTLFIRHYARSNLLVHSIALVALGTIAFMLPPTTPAQIVNARNIAQSVSIPRNASLLHDHSPALAYFIDNFSGTVFHFNGQYQPHIESFAERDDLQSMIVALAPDFILTSTTDEIIFDSTNLTGLQYEQSPIEENLWHRQADVRRFSEDSSATTISFSPDVTLTGYNLDQIRVHGDNVLRIRLDWTLNRTPEDAIGVNISLLDIDQIPAVSIFTRFPMENWQSDNLSTYHSLALPEDIDSGLHNIQVGLDYRAGLLGVYRIAPVIVPFEGLEPTDNPIGRLGSVNVFVLETRAENEQLQLDLAWQTTEILNRDYRVFIHITDMDNLQPITQDDGFPLNGRYPTTFWLTEDVIDETRTVNISELASGTYRINLGLYTPADGRLQGGEGDYIFIGTLIVDEDRSAEVMLNND